MYNIDYVGYFYGDEDFPIIFVILTNIIQAESRHMLSLWYT